MGHRGKSVEPANMSVAGASKTMRFRGKVNYSAVRYLKKDNNNYHFNLNKNNQLDMESRINIVKVNDEECPIYQT